MGSDGQGPPRWLVREQSRPKSVVEVGLRRLESWGRVKSQKLVAGHDKAQLFTKLECPVKGPVDKCRVGDQWENSKEIIEVVAHMHWNVALQDPVERLCKEIENIWGQACAKCKDNIVVQLLLPFETQKQPVSMAHQDVAKCQFEVQFEHLEAWS
ncbi:hypothetical protein C0993_008755 [Termitomyces sp. T159_Od127]|nr:hypothetical protein C0993_008755 [Termitomyces sp. T159_Od127]